MADELKACPFCANAMASPFVSKRYAGWLVECGSCGAHKNSAQPTAAEAIADWNRRAAPAVPVATAPVANQCDGCREGLFKSDGIHYRDGKVWIGCTAEKFASSRPATQHEGLRTDKRGKDNV